MSDLISRQDAIDAMDKLWGDIKRTHKRVAKGHEAVYLDMRGTIKTLPSADRPTGHIVTKCSGKFNPTVWAECSECGKPIDAWDKFCRHCGAKMGGDTE